MDTGHDVGATFDDTCVHTQGERKDRTATERCGTNPDAICGVGARFDVLNVIALNFSHIFALRVIASRLHTPPSFIRRKELAIGDHRDLHSTIVFPHWKVWNFPKLSGSLGAELLLI